MIKLVEQLCNINAPSGNESAVNTFIIEQIKDYAEITVTPLGSIIAKKLRGPEAKKNIMLDAHTDEVGLIITDVTDDGFARFNCVGGIEPAIMAQTKVNVNGVFGVVVGKAVHFLSKDEQKNAVSADNLYIDFGTSSREETLSLIRLGDTGVFCGETVRMGDCLRAKALDDRVGCAIIIDMLRDDSLPKFSASFSVQEEVGQAGAKTSAYIIKPDAAIILEGTTACDIPDVSPAKQVCVLGNGPAISFMDRTTLYDKKLYNHAISCGIKCQAKAAVAGGNDSGVIHTSLCGCPTLTVSVPCRYIHSPSCVCNLEDIAVTRDFAAKMLYDMALGNLV